MSLAFELPEALTSREQAELKRLADMGDESARDKLIVTNLRIITLVIKRRFQNTDYSEEDLFQYGAIGLINAVDTWKPEKGMFVNWAFSCISNGICKELRVSKFKKDYSFVSSDLPDDDERQFIKDTIPDPTAESFFLNVEDEENLREIKEALTNLPLKRRRVITMRYGLDGKAPLTQPEISAILGNTQPHISRLERYGIRDLRKILRRNV